MLLRWKTQRPEGMMKDGKVWFTLGQLTDALGIDTRGANSFLLREIAGATRSAEGVTPPTDKAIRGPSGKPGKFYLLVP